jgi:hypothetical protein
VTSEFKKSVLETNDKDWHPIYEEFDGKRIKTNQKWTEVCFVPLFQLFHHLIVSVW